MITTPAIQAGAETGRPSRRSVRPDILLGGGMLALIAAAAILAPAVTGHDPGLIDPGRRLQPPSAEHWFGTDRLGRDVFNRTVWSARVSLWVAATTVAVTLVAGSVLGMLAGYVRLLDPLVLRTMDGIDAIPAILLGIALMVLSGGHTGFMIVAIAVPGTPQVVRLIRSVVLSVREEPFVEAAVALGTPTSRVLARHILPSVAAPMAVIGSYIAAYTTMAETALSFLGAGTPPEVPSWGNMITEARMTFQIAPWAVFFPAAALGVMVLAVNLLGDGLRDALDPRVSKGLSR